VFEHVRELVYWRRVEAFGDILAWPFWIKLKIAFEGVWNIQIPDLVALTVYKVH